MGPNSFDVLIGLRLSIVRRAADMLGLHFGEVRPHPSGSGTVGAWTLHVQCPWRLDAPKGTFTGSGDLWVYAGPGEQPSNWSYEDGSSLQDRKFAELFPRDESTRSWVNQGAGFVVTAVLLNERGEIELEFANGYAISVFPAGSKSEAWRLFASGGDHLVFPTAETDFAISRRKPGRFDPDWEAWLRLVEAPSTGSAIETPPPVILAADGTRYRCGRCGRVLAIAEFGALRGFVIHCGNCGRYNEVPL